MKHRMLKTEVGQKAFKILGKCTRSGTQTLDMSGKDERGQRKKK